MYLILDVVKTLDLSAITARYELHGRNARGDELPAELARRESRLAKMRGEWLLVCLTSNLKKLFCKEFAETTRTGNGCWALAVE